MPPVRYRSAEEDSARWLRFPVRDGDIDISTRSRSGTTWMQMLCAVLVLRTPDLPAPLATLSPWLDWLAEPEDEVLGRLAAQRHRRFVKTHTPLDGQPLHPAVTYVVVARHPLDAAELGVVVRAEEWPALVEATTFASMRGRAGDLAPDPAGELRDRQSFFRRGTSAAGREAAGPDGYARYLRRAAELAPPGLLAWLHRPN